MIESVASLAPRTPPETGASIIAAPRALTSLASLRVLEGSAVVISTRRCRRSSAGSIAPTTASTSRDDGTIVMIVSECRATSAGEPAHSAPRSTSGRAAPG